jgi:hypothetical protein
MEDEGRLESTPWDLPPYELSVRLERLAPGLLDRYRRLVMRFKRLRSVADRITDLHDREIALEQQIRLYESE